MDEKDKLIASMYLAMQKSRKDPYLKKGLTEKRRAELRAKRKKK